MFKYYLGILISLLFFNQTLAKNINIQENINLTFKCELEKKIIKNSEYNYQVFLLPGAQTIAERRKRKNTKKIILIIKI